jgi:hypothetical protein
METGKKYRGIGQAGGREKQREQIREKEREVVLGEMRDGLSRNECWC